MRHKLWLDLILVGALTTHCQPRDPIEDKQEQEPQTSTNENMEAVTAPDTDSNQTSDTAIAKEREEVVVPTTVPVVTGTPPVVTSRMESLSFTHDSSLCAQVQADRSVNLQMCNAGGKGQTFLFSRGLDGRYQLRETNSQLCLGISVGFIRSLLIAEPCESKSSQFFSVIDYQTSYSLRQDLSNSCLDAEDFGTAPGTRIIVYRCTSGSNQKIKVIRSRRSGRDTPNP